jgi:pimeloyl-ACP methyl ester carboxylesterase
LTSANWSSHWADIDGPVHYLDFGGPARGPLIVGVHGLGGFAANWSALAPLLTDRCRVIAPDLAGHGLTPTAGRGTGVVANRLLLHRFIEKVAARPVILMGNSMGGMISLLEASAEDDLVAGVILVDPALPFAPAWPDPIVTGMLALTGTPVVGRMVLGHVQRLAPESLVAAVLASICTDPSRVPAEAVAEQVAVVRERRMVAGAWPDLAAATRSVIVTAASASYRQGLRAIRQPVLLIHGGHDRVIPVSAARGIARANPDWSLVVLRGVGHVPQLEAADECAAVITRWLNSAAHPAARAAAPSMVWPAGQWWRAWRRWRQSRRARELSPARGRPGSEESVRRDGLDR